MKTKKLFCTILLVTSTCIQKETLAPRHLNHPPSNRGGWYHQRNQRLVTFAFLSGMIGASLADKIQENNTLKSDRRKPGHKLLPSNQIWIELNNTVYQFIVEAIKTKDNKHILHGYTRNLRLHPLDELRVKIVFKKEQDGSHMGEGGEWFPESVHIVSRSGVKTTYQRFDYTIRAKEIHIKIPSLSDRSSYWLS